VLTVAESTPPCDCGGNLIPSGRWKTSYPGMGSATCDRCGHKAGVWQGSNGKVHTSLVAALDSDRETLAQVRNCSICGKEETAGVTCGHSIRACPDCYLECRELRIGLFEAVHNPARLAALRAKRAS
jgi:ribosomal protein S14